MKTYLKIFSVLAVLAMIVSLVPVSATADDPLTTSVRVSVSTKGTPPETPEAYTIRMTANGDCPMPGGKTGGTADLTITGPGKGSFPAMSFDNVGIYTYTIKQVAGANKDAKYDSSVYELKITIYRDNGKLMLATALRKKGVEEKLDVCAFEVIYPVATVDLTVSKVWKDEDDKDGVRPNSLIVVLSADGKAIGQVTLNAGNKWTGTIKGQPEFKENTRTPIVYTWSESQTKGYTKTGEEKKDTTTTITNTHEPETTELTVKKVWNDNNAAKRPASLTVYLKNGDTVVQTVKLTADNNWSATVTKLPKFADGKEIKYTWTEEAVAGYSLAGSKTEGQVTTLTNKVNGGGGGTPTYTVTVKYEYEDGTPAAPNTVITRKPGQNYSIDSPVIPGYTPSIPVVEGTVPNHNVTIVVVYVPDYKTPLGLGNVSITVGECYE